jgi:F0F1-type ATP synthase assembly protein I
MIAAKETKQQVLQGYSNILVLSTWGFAIVLCSFLFLYVGYWIDRALNTAPSFMLGLFLLAIFLCVGRLYQEAWIKRKG